MNSDRGFLPLLSLILIAVLVPTACIIYFMNEAMNNQSDIARKRLAQAYRGPFHTIVRGVETSWRTRLSKLDDLEALPVERFRIATDQLHLADAIVRLNDKGEVLYPPVPPTTDAERLAARYIAAGLAHPGEGVLRHAKSLDLWTLTSPNRRVIALYREKTIADLMLSDVMWDILAPLPNITIGILPPTDIGYHDLTETAGGPILGWKIALDIGYSPQSAEAVERRRIGYLWVGVLVIGTLGVTGLVAGRIFVRQVKLTRLKTDLVATVSHELKTPLAGMRLLVDTLLDDDEPDPVRTREYLQLISRENARLSRLIDNFLTFSRMERNRAQFSFSAVRPEAVVSAAVEAVGERYAVEVSVQPGLPAIQADEDALVTVVLNLLDNACKYSGEDRRIELGVYAENGRCCFAVKDNGQGIPARLQRKIFRKFYQVDRHLTRRPGGVGLGLSIVEFIVRAHGGTVGVESKVGAGSRFVVSLPAGGAA
jgi:signal transduction histidine kinase